MIIQTIFLHFNCKLKSRKSHELNLNAEIIIFSVYLQTGVLLGGQQERVDSQALQELKDPKGVRALRQVGQFRSKKFVRKEWEHSFVIADED